MNNGIEEKNRNCEVTPEQMNIFFKKIHKNKFERRIVNINKNLWILILLTPLPFIISMINALSVFKISQIYFYLLYCLSFIFIAHAYIKTYNRAFNNLDTYNKQFYILYLLRNRLEVCSNECKVEDERKKIIKELNQIGMHFNWLIYDSLKFYRKINLFNISVEEQYLRDFYISLNKRVLPNLRKGLYLSEISIVIKNLLKITYNLIPNYENINKITNPHKYSIDLFAECINDLNTIPIVEEDKDEKKSIKLKIKRFFKLENNLNLIIIPILIFCLYLLMCKASISEVTASVFVGIATATLIPLLKKQ
ncbi:hypothetical protein [Ruminiclostridium papyrosolvens]|uniref:Uncharacterized protein n=1 Tax=Ruminiclostridium papyrosolvens C7 TaxID=1330534 RepID=U4QWU2_9FIRM|nr:hypothetical protein [Ruminiclostridium papyrosolvens]EPR07801.1 hypothetical protein L323_20110 [Ruminiclostridium papyrosolvens C7]